MRSTRAHVDHLLAEEGVALRQNEVRGGVDALGIARSEERVDRASMRGHVREEAVVRGVRVLLEDHLEDAEEASQVRVQEGGREHVQDVCRVALPVRNGKDRSNHCERSTVRPSRLFLDRAYVCV